jgi:hypothetical protein
MAKFRSHKNSLIGGELSPTAFGRIDIPQYGHACKTLRNMLPLLSGGAYRRPGSRFETSFDYDTDLAPGLIPFVVSKTEAYCLLFGSTYGFPYLKAYRPTSNSSGATAAATVVGSPPYIGRIVVDTTSWGYYDEWHEVQYVQSADVMWLTYPRYKPQKIIRTSANNLKICGFDTDSSGTTLTGSDLRDAYPYLAQNATSQTMAISNAAVGAGRTLTSSTAFFQTGHIGAIFKSNIGGTIGSCQVTAVAFGGLTATVTVLTAFGSTAATTAWWESAWSDYRGWPRSVDFIQFRLVYGGTASYPDSMWFSKTNTYGVMSTSTDTDPNVPAASTSGFTLTMGASRQLNLIQWLSAGDNSLLIGTQQDEWVAAPINAELGFYGGNIGLSKKSSYGSSYTAAIRKSDEVIFCGSSESELRGLVFNNDQQSYVAEPIQAYYDEFPYAEPFSYIANGNRKIRKMGWDQSRRTLWCIDTAGNLRALTRDRQVGINTWTSHEMGGFDASQIGSIIGIDLGGSNYTTDPAYYICAGSVISLAVLPNPLIGTDDIWLVVKRKISGGYEYHLERLIGRNYPLATAYSVSNPEGSYLVDAAVFVQNNKIAPAIVADVFSGLDHLEGEIPVGTAFNSRGIFKVIGSAIVSGDTTLESTSAFGLDTETTTHVVMGLNYESVVEPVRLEAGSQVGSAQGAIKRIHQLVTRFYRTIAAKIGRDADTLETLVFRESDTPSGDSPELFTGDKPRPFNGTYDRDGLVYILQDQPLPFAVVSITAEGLEYDGG